MAREKLSDLEKVHVHIRLTPAMFNRIRRIAGINFETISEVMARMVLASLDEEELQAEANRNARPKTTREIS
jgi:hypothetical protein